MTPFPFWSLMNFHELFGLRVFPGYCVDWNLRILHERKRSTDLPQSSFDQSYTGIHRSEKFLCEPSFREHGLKQNVHVLETVEPVFPTPGAALERPSHCD